MSKDLIIYTDSSVKNSFAGAGIIIYSNRNIISEQYLSLGNDTMIFQAELIAIATLCDILLDAPSQITKTTHIFTDSRSAIEALSATVIFSKTVHYTLKKLRLLSRHTCLLIRWIPAHSGYLDNEHADQLANLGSDTLPIGPHPFALYSCSYINHQVDNQISSEHYRRLFSSRDPHSFNQQLILMTFNNRIYPVFSHSKTEVRILVHILTGWNYLKYF